MTAGARHDADDPLDIRLSALLDGETGEDDGPDPEAGIADDTQAQRVLDQLKLGNSSGREVFEELLKEPVPLDLVRYIKTSFQPRKAVSLPSASHPVLSFRPTAIQSLVACLVCLVIGGGMGFLLAKQPAVARQPLIAENDSRWLDDIVAHYRVFSRQTNRPVELPASEPTAIVEWLFGSTGVNFRIPDLSENGLTFEGARLFVAGGMPVGYLAYTSRDGEAIAILFRKNLPGEDDFSELIRDNIALMSWKSPSTTYIVVGPSSATSLDEIAAKAAGLI